VTIRLGHRVVAILSLHQLGAPRAWTAAEVELCRGLAVEIARLL
jgi:GAF domain-containing protein